MSRIVLIFFLLSALAVIPTQSQVVHAVTIDGPIGPATAAFFTRALETANEAGSTALLMRLNTPGGLLQATRTIVSDILSSPIPILVYVSPGGAQAGSAGTFITLAGHVAAMAPGTNIGAAHPVGLQGQADSVMGEKATNDAAAFIRSIAQLRKRNLTLAEDAVRKSISLSDSEALASNVIDIVVLNEQMLLEKVNGWTVKGPSSDLILHTTGCSIVEIEPTFPESLLAILSDPNIAYILFLLGVYGLMFELYNPGSILPGVVGGISLILALYAFQTLPLNYAGAALMIFAIILFILEIKITSHGILGIGGTIAFMIGSAMLVNPSSSLEFAAISWSLILLAAALTGFFFMYILGLGLKAQRQPPSTGAEGLLGAVGEVLTALDPEGTVRVHGEQWTAQSASGTIPAGTRVTVIQLAGMKLTVEQKKSTPENPT